MHALLKVGIIVILNFLALQVEDIYSPLTDDELISGMKILNHNDHALNGHALNDCHRQTKYQ